VQDGVLYRSNGSIADANVLDGTGFLPNNLTTIFATGTAYQLPSEATPTTMRDGWTIDVASDSSGLPYVAFQARANNSTLDHRFFYGRFNGSTWNVHEVAKAGSYLYSAEDDYTGLMALDPNDPDRLFISSKIDPRTQVAMPHYEIFEGNTADGGATWAWDPITYNSTMDNIRPIVPKWDSQHTALLWMRGTYSTYNNYNMAIVGLTFASLPGDFNNDGKVDAADYVVWRKQSLSAEKYQEWRANFGAAAGSGSALPLGESPAVPEPTTILLLASALTARTLHRTRRK
jgi:hypothetical protein